MGGGFWLNDELDMILEESGRELLDVLSRNFLGKKQGNHGKKPVRLACSPRRESNRSPLEYGIQRYRYTNPLEYMEISGYLHAGWPPPQPV
jgi:hypothetical protein